MISRIRIAGPVTQARIGLCHSRGMMEPFGGKLKGLAEARTVRRRGAGRAAARPRDRTRASDGRPA